MEFSGVKKYAIWLTQSLRLNVMSGPPDISKSNSEGTDQLSGLNYRSKWYISKIKRSKLLDKYC